MPSYDYLCRNKECSDPEHLERFCSVKESKILPKCSICDNEMPKAFLEMPNVSWRFLTPSGNWRTSNRGPSQRADRRHAGWDRSTGQKVLQPIYKEGRKKND